MRLFGPIIRRLWEFMTPHSASLYAGLACTAVGAGIEVGYGLLLKGVIDAIKEGENTSGLDFYGAVILVVFGARALFSFGQRFFISNATEKMTRDLRNRLYGHLLGLPLRFFEDRRTGQLMASITTDVPAIQETFRNGVIDLIQSPIVILGALALMLYLSPVLTLTVLVVVPVMLKVIQAASRRMRKASTQIQERLQDISDRLQESLAGIRVIQSFTAEDMEKRRFEEQSQEAMRAAMRAVRVQAAMAPAIEFIAMGGFVIVLWVGGRLITAGNLEFGALAAFLLSVQKLGAAGKSFGNIQLHLRRLESAAERLFALLDTRSDMVEKPDARVLESAQGNLHFDAVSFAYSDGAPVLRDISFRAAPGEVVALVGPSGAGKTTIANLVPRFYDVTAGRIRLDGWDLRDLSLPSLRRLVGIVPQETLLFSGTIRDNIRYGRVDATDEEIRQAARAANAETFIESLPEGYDTLVGERGAKLSGGQRQRVAIARALLKDPRILILDEATSALDTESESLVQEALTHLMVGRTTLVIAHRLSTIRNADRILVLERGEVAEEGTHDQLLQRGGLYARLHEMQYRTGDPGTELPEGCSPSRPSRAAGV